MQFQEQESQAALNEAKQRANIMGIKIEVNANGSNYVFFLVSLRDITPLQVVSRAKKWLIAVF